MAASRHSGGGNRQGGRPPGRTFPHVFPVQLDEPTHTFVEAMTASMACSKAEAVRVALRFASAHLRYEDIPRYRDPPTK